MEQRAHGMNVWRNKLSPLRLPKFFDLRADPFERADIEAGNYDRWSGERFFLMVPSQAVVGEFLDTFKEFPPRQKSSSFGVDQALEAMQSSGSGR
jgi:arylsulfatase